MYTEKAKRRNKFRTTVYQSGLAQSIFNRDGYKCRYCKIEVMDTSMLWKIVEVKQNEFLDLYRKGKITERKYLKISRSDILFKQVYKNANKYFATIDHIIPIALGGDDSKLNLVTACLICNIKKGKKLWHAKE